ncbi:MAG: threonine-phosphate decarboxylase CobD [Candidatus Nitrosotenuis sp.]
MKFAKNIQFHKTVLHGGPYSILGHDSKIIDFSSNVNPLGTPNSVKKALGLAKISAYPDHDSSKLKQALAKYLGVSVDNVVVGNGATEIIYDFCRATISKSTSVLITSPTFGEYEAASSLCGAKLRFFKTLNLESDLESFIQKIPQNGIVFVCNPNNPTGEFLQKKLLTQIIRTAKAKSAIVFVDECFIELTRMQDQSVVDLISKFPNLFVLRSMTKSFGLAGLRLGYAIGNKALVSILNKIKIPWSVNALAHQAGLAALSDTTFLAKSQKLIQSESKFLINSISRLDGFSCFDTATNFVLIKTKQPSKTIQKKLLQKNILVRDCSNFRGLNSHYIRVAVRTHKENQKLVSALESIR